MKENNKTDKSSQVEELKEVGNNLMKEEKYMEAVVEYTHAIKLDPEYYQLYSNRCLAFTKLKQYYYALQDAYQTINLQPNWAKGYFRKGEIEFAVERYEDAIYSYTQAVKLSEGKEVLPHVMKAIQFSDQQKKFERKLPWVGVAVGFILAVCLICCNYYFSTGNQRILMNPGVLVLLIMIMSSICYFVAKTYLYLKKRELDALLEPPIDIFNKKQPKEEKVEEQKPRTRYNKAAAYQRYKNKKKTT